MEQHPKNRLSEFRLEKIKQRQAFNLSKKISKQYENKFSINSEIARVIIIQDEVSKSLFLSKLSSWAKDIPVEGLSSEWEKNIKKTVSKLFKKKYDHFLKSLIEEVRQIYLDELQNFSLKTILAIDTDQKDKDKLHKSNYDSFYKTRNSISEYCESFSKNRKSLSKKYFLSQRLIIYIMNTAFFNLPRLFIDLIQYRVFGVLPLSEFDSKIKKNIKKVSLKILSHYYNKIVKALPKLNMKNINATELPRVIHSATVLFAQQILDIKMNTITHLINSIKDPLSSPLLKLDLIFENNSLIIKPSVEEIRITYHEIIDIVSDIAQDLVPFESWLEIKANQDFIKLKLPEWFLQESHNKLEQVLENIFQSLNEYHLHVNHQFQLISAGETKTDVLKLVSENREFEEYCSQVKMFMNYLGDVNKMVSKIYYDIGILNQIQAKQVLKSRTFDLITILVESLTKNHEEETRSICFQFETLKSRALNIPKDAKSLFELSEYMAHGAKDLVSNLEKRVQRSVQILSSLLEITILSPNHIELNRQSINWIESIKPIFMQSNTLSEAMKSESEDELQRRITILSSEIDNLVPEFVILDDMDDARQVQEYVEYLKALSKKVNLIKKQIYEINFEEKLFKFPETSFPKHAELKEVIEPFYDLVRLICEWQRDHEVWLKGPFEYLDAIVIEKKTKYFFEEISESNKAFKSKIKMDLTSNKAYKFSGIVDDPDPMQQPAPVKLCLQVLQDISSFMNFVPLAICFCNSALRKRHWDEMSSVSGQELFPNAGTTFNKIIELNLMSHIEMLQVISKGAKKELALQIQLESMFQEWESISFQIFRTANIYSFIESEKIEILLEDHFTKIQNIKGSYFIKPVETRASELFKALTQIQIFSKQFLSLQFQTKKFLPLFSNRRAASQLSEEEILFSSVKETLNKIIKSVSLSPTFEQVAKDPLVIKNLEDSISKMKNVEESVQIYLEKIRFDFARFFFISDEQVLKILFDKGDTSLGFSILACFPGVKKFLVTKSLKINSIIGDYGEKMRLLNSIDTHKFNENVTDCLVKVEETIRKTLREKIFETFLNFDIESFHRNISNYPAIVNFSSWQLYWTNQVQNSLQSFDIENLKSFKTKQNNLISKELEHLKCITSRLHRKIISAIVTLQIYQKDITKLLITKNIRSETDFEWKAQIRYYSTDKNIQVNLMNASINYGYEYNNQFLIVNTPLTERCYRTLMEAYYHNYFGSIVGPSGSGKTETIRSLAKAFALLFQVYNGNDKLSFNFVDTILKGLVSSGAWICFKNFDRIKEGILSLISQRIATISKSRTIGIVDFDGTSINFNKSGFISITMNPESWKRFDCSKELYYSKKLYLPEMIKFQFRTITILSPDINRICEIELFASGFTKAESLALKIKTFYKLAKELLKKFDFGLRSIKLVLKTATCLKEKFPEDENTLILRALVDVNLSKLNEFQIPIFRGILEDIFPGVSLPNPDYKKFLEALEEVCKKNCLEGYDGFKLKIIQIFEMIHVRNGIIIIGEALAGKSTILKTLADVLEILNDKIILETINPVAVTIDHLYGYFDEKFKEWKDGIFPKILYSFSKHENLSDKNISSSKTLSKKWIIFDGPIHTWVENLDPFLDNNKKIILNSHEKISKPREMTIFIETLNLHEASPLTISRSGIINIESQGWRNYIKPMIKNVTLKSLQIHEKLIYSLFDWTIEPCLEFIYKNCKMIIKVNKIHLVIATFNLFIILLEDLKENCPEKGKLEHIMAWIQATFIISTSWALTGTLDFDSLKLFNSFYVSLWNNSTGNRPDSLKQIEGSLPSEGLIRDYIYIFKGNGTWKLSSDFLKTETFLENPRFKEIFIPTVDSIKYSIILQKHINQKKPFLLCSAESSGKTCFLQDLLSNKLTENFSTNCFNFPSRITVSKSQRIFLSKLKKIKPGVYGPYKEFCINFVDDLNNSQNSSDVLELMRQYFDYGFWYDSEESKKIFIHDMMFVSATGKPNSKICGRFLRHFNIYIMHESSKESMFRIFSNLLLLNLKKNAFAMDMMPTLNGIVNGTIDFYFWIKETLRPIPGNYQYIFNLRDISRIIRGCSIVQRESVESKTTFIRLWVHEIFRVFGDRIIQKEDQDLFFSKLKECVKSHFKDPFESVFDHLPKIKHEELTKESFKFLIFGNIDDSRKYEEIHSMDALQNKVNSYIKEYNTEHKNKLDIAIPHFILEHLIRICRVMAIPGEHLLMICSSGFGRRSLIRLAAFIEKQNLFEPDLDSYYDLESWRDDLKRLLKKCGSGNEDYSIMVTDRQFKNKNFKHTFLEDVASLVTTTQIPELFSSTDEREIVQKVRLAAQGGNRNSEMRISEILEYFVKECKMNLHFFICISSLQISKPKYLPLIKSSTLNYLSFWPKEAFEKVGLFFLNMKIKEELKSQIITSSIFFHNFAIKNLLDKIEIPSPSIFIRFLKLYTKTVSKKQKELKISRSKYVAGLEKLKLASNQVDQMKKALTTLRPQLESSACQTRATMKEIENENILVEKATIIVKDEEEIANQKAEIAGKLRTECETDLAVAIPILEDAVSALNTLKPTDITLVKAMKNPPDTIKLVMAAVCVMLDVSAEKILDPVTGKKSSDFWGPSKRVLGDMNFLQNLKDYDKDNISSSIMQVIKSTYMTDKSFLPHIVAKASSAAEGLCKWVRAMVSYDEVAKAVAPKKEKLALAQRECDDAEAYLTEKRQTLADLNEKLAALKISLETVLAKKMALENEVEDCTDRLEKAESLLTSLGGEKNRWIGCTNNLQESIYFLAGDVLLACGLIIYAASYNLEKRDLIMKEWKDFVKVHKIPCSENFNFARVLGTENQFNSWYLSGLVKDPFFLQNAVIIDNSDKWCLFIDPHDQAKEWIQIFEKGNELKIIKANDKNSLEVIKGCITFGNPLLVENFEALIASLDPVLLQAAYHESNQIYLDIREEKIVYSPNFKLYITTRVKNPKFSVDIYNRVTLVDFTFPGQALTGQLLDTVIAKENYQLQDKYEKLLIQLSYDKMSLNQEEEKVLEILSASNMNILENKVAMKILDSSKNFSVDILKREKASLEIKQKIDLFRENYRDFAKYSAGLYSTIESLSNLNRFYHFSLPWFFQIYIKAIETSKRSVVLEKRLDYLKFGFTRKLHTSMRNCLLEKDKLLYSFVLCVKILKDEGKISKEEIELFKNFKNLTDKLIPVKWEPEKFKEEISKINESLGENFLKNLSDWQLYFENPRNSVQGNKDITAFQKLIITKIIRPDQILISIFNFVETILGSLSNDKFQTRCDISMAFEESNCLTPLIFILPSHMALLPILSKFAKRKRYSSKLLSLSMSEDQGQKAELLIKDAQKEEKWVFLENCHLAPSWMSKLEKIVDSLNASNTTLEFRLWLSSFPSDKFPLSVLQSGIKIACDSPVGLKESLLWVYNSEPVNEKKFFDGCPGKDKTFSKLLYGLSFFHAIVKERRNYGHRGWNISYDFNESDFSLSAIQLQHLINENKKMPFEAFLYLIEECSYGSKIANEVDRKRLRVFIEDYCNLKIVKDPSYSFFNDPEFLIPRRSEFRDYVKQVREIKEDCDPEIFGLDENCGIIQNLSKVENFVDSFNCLNEIKFQDEPEEKKVREVMSGIRDRIGRVFDLEEIKEKYGVSYEEPLNEVLIQEIKVYNYILIFIETSFCGIESAYDGFSLWNSDCSYLSKNLVLNYVPESWKIRFKITECSVSSFITNLSKRMNFLENWVQNGHSKIYCLGTLNCSKSLFTAIRLKFSRSENLSINEINFDFEITSSFELSKETSSNIFQIHGLLLSGGQWHLGKKMLIKSLPKIFWHEMPVICLKVKTENVNYFENGYECPLYNVPFQGSFENYIDGEDNLILYIFLRTERNVIYWIKRGTALYCKKE